MDQDSQVGQVIRISHIDQRINGILKEIDSSEIPTGRHYNQNEEFFLRLATEFTVPNLPIHHDVSNSRPGPAYADAIADVLGQLAAITPGLFREATYYFDPTDILRPRFFRLYKIQDRRYLYLMRVDLMYRAQEHTVLQRGTNDLTPHYRSSRLFVEGMLVPLDDSQAGQDDAFRVRQSFSETWLGERGRGYFVQGIWIDHDLTKFFSKLFLPRGVKSYPFYPFVCRYRTVCEAVIDLSPEGRKSRLPYLHRALEFIAPMTERIQNDLRNQTFSEDLAIFKEMKEGLPALWNVFYGNLRVTAYLNENDMREFRVETASGAA